MVISAYLRFKLNALRKQAYSNILNFFSFQIKILIFFIDCRYSLEPPRRGGSNEYPQRISSKNKKINIYIALLSPVLLYKSGV